MIRIGIIGTENSNAIQFARAINLPDPKTGTPSYPDMRVTCLYGPDPDTARRVAEEITDAEILDSAEAMLDQVDAVMITNRWGSKHLQYALPFAERGIPLFVDKPLTSDPDEANTLIRTAEQHGALMTGGSGCKYAWDIEILKTQAQRLTESGELLAASMNFAADTESPYDGFYFYSPHLTEMALTVFGPNVHEVYAVESPGGVTALWRYDTFDATLHYTRNSTRSQATLYGQNANITREINIDMIYRLEVERFVEMLRTKQMPHTYAELAKPVQMIDAILRSLESGQSVRVERD